MHFVGEKRKKPVLKRVELIIEHPPMAFVHKRMKMYLDLQRWESISAEIRKLIETLKLKYVQTV